MDNLAIDGQLTVLCNRLTGPTLSLDHLSLCDHNPDILALFIERLDNSDPSSTGNILYSLLKELSALNISPLEKLALLNLTHPLTLRCADNLSKTKLSPKTAKSITLSQALLKHLASGFRSVVSGIGHLDSVPRQQLAQALSSALEVQSVMYLKSLQFYLSTSRNFWADAHLLYRIAKHGNIPTPQRGNQHITVYCHYYRLLLIACCGPNQLPSSDLNRVFQALPQWSDTIQLSEEIQKSDLFVVDIESDLPPFYLSNLTKKTAKDKAAGYRRLNLDRLINYLEGKLYNEPDAILIDTLPRRLVTSLCRNWSIESSRQSERDNMQRTMELIYGLSYAHNALAETNFEHFLNNLNTIESPSSKEKFQIEEIDQSSGQRVASVDPDQDIWRHAPDVANTRAKPAASTMTMKGPALKNEEAGALNTLQASLVNTSARGACLEFASAQHPKVMPGEVICCRAEQDDPWQLGIVRWKRITPHLLMQLGIELLPMTAEPRAARVLRQNQPAGPYLPALLLQPEENQSHAMQILLPVMPFKQGDRIHLLGGKRGMVATLSVPIDATSHISRFTLNDTSGQ